MTGMTKTPDLGELDMTPTSVVVELRRLEAVNTQLLEALEKMVAIHDEPSGFAGKYGKTLDAAIEQQKIKIEERLRVARAAIKAAKGQS